MAQILKLAHFVEHHGMADMQIGGGGVEAELNSQRNARFFALLQLFKPFFLRQ